MDEIPEVVKDIPTEDLIVQEVAPLDQLWRWWGNRRDWEATEERLSFQVRGDGSKESINTTSVQELTRASLRRERLCQ